MFAPEPGNADLAVCAVCRGIGKRPVRHGGTPSGAIPCLDGVAPYAVQHPSDGNVRDRCAQGTAFRRDYVILLRRILVVARHRLDARDDVGHVDHASVEADVVDLAVPAKLVVGKNAVVVVSEVLDCALKGPYVLDAVLLCLTTPLPSRNPSGAVSATGSLFPFVYPLEKWLVLFIAGLDKS